MRPAKLFLTLGLPLSLVLGLLSLQLTATLKHKRETSKKCVFCHSGIPEMEDEDPQLNQEGKKFRENGFKLTEDQKKKANARPSSRFPCWRTGNPHLHL